MLEQIVREAMEIDWPCTRQEVTQMVPWGGVPNVASSSGVSILLLFSRSRRADVCARRRQIARQLYAAPHYWTQERIAEHFGRDRSTVAWWLNHESGWR